MTTDCCTGEEMSVTAPTLGFAAAVELDPIGPLPVVGPMPVELKPSVGLAVGLSAELGAVAPVLAGATPVELKPCTGSRPVELDPIGPLPVVGPMPVELKPREPPPVELEAGPAGELTKRTGVSTRTGVSGMCSNKAKFAVGPVRTEYISGGTAAAKGTVTICEVLPLDTTTR
jgi:hypothetical protein